ncbi:6-phosphogluconate dehydrogenase, NADP(+)-dependent, decarboxylating [Candidatus Zixiibacteriota bacterium]|nr:6-phosphogluconate dehydrogenase, NADP(+)-dependent, decarboxylating [candidate division Zixibacteria bacterium]
MDNFKGDIGLVGLGVMGQNLALNIADHGFSVVGMDRQEDKIKALVARGDGQNVHGVGTAAELVSKLKSPRKVLLLVPAGGPVDSAITELSANMGPGDIIIDGGNSHFTDTNRHAAELGRKKINFLGVGISGGAEGARYGPSMMPGGPKESYEQVRSIFEAISAKVEGEPCVTYLGPGAAGHYVKMVHNGIEYALMQLIAETYDILRRIGGLSNDDLAGIFEDWNRGAINSFLMEITSKILRVKDNRTNQRLIDMIQDTAHQKGTGKWTSQDAMELQVPVPTIDAAVSARDLSGFKAEREIGAKIFPLASQASLPDTAKLAGKLSRALQFSMIVAYNQGMMLLRAASRTYKYNLNLADIARIWRGGCIIRAAMLNDMKEVFQNEPGRENLMTAEPFADILKNYRPDLSEIIKLAADHEIASPGLASALAYFDAFRTFRLPANLIQAQRDYFGSHTYERIDDDGIFHTDWN